MMDICSNNNNNNAAAVVPQESHKNAFLIANPTTTTTIRGRNGAHRRAVKECRIVDSNHKNEVDDTTRLMYTICVNADKRKQTSALSQQPPEVEDAIMSEGRIACNANEITERVNTCIETPLCVAASNNDSGHNNRNIPITTTAMPETNTNKTITTHTNSNCTNTTGRRGNVRYSPVKRPQPRSSTAPYRRSSTTAFPNTTTAAMGAGLYTRFMPLLKEEEVRLHAQLYGRASSCSHITISTPFGQKRMVSTSPYQRPQRPPQRAAEEHKQHARKESLLQALEEKPRTTLQENKRHHSPLLSSATGGMATKARLVGHSPLSKQHALLPTRGEGKTRNNDAGGMCKLLRPPSLGVKSTEGRSTSAIDTTTTRRRTGMVRRGVFVSTSTAGRGVATQQSWGTQDLSPQQNLPAAQPRENSVAMATMRVNVRPRPVIRTASAPCLPPPTSIDDPTGVNGTKSRVDMRVFKNQSSSANSTVLGGSNRTRPLDRRRSTSAFEGQYSRQPFTLTSPLTNAPPPSTNAHTNTTSRGRGVNKTVPHTPSPSALELQSQDQECPSRQLVKAGITPKPNIRPTQTSLARETATRQREQQYIQCEHERLAAEVPHLPRNTWFVMRRELERLVGVQTKRSALARDGHAPSVGVNPQTKTPVTTTNTSTTTIAKTTNTNSTTVGAHNEDVPKEDRGCMSCDGMHGGVGLMDQSPRTGIGTTKKGEETKEKQPKRKKGVSFTSRQLSVASSTRQYRRNSSNAECKGSLPGQRRFLSPYRGPTSRDAALPHSTTPSTLVRRSGRAYKSPPRRHLEPTAYEMTTSVSIAAENDMSVPTMMNAGRSHSMQKRGRHNMETEEIRWSSSRRACYNKEQSHTHSTYTDGSGGVNRNPRRSFTKHYNHSSRSPSIRPPSEMGMNVGDTDTALRGSTSPQTNAGIFLTNVPTLLVSSPVLLDPSYSPIPLLREDSKEKKKLGRKRRSLVSALQPQRKSKVQMKAPVLNFCRTRSAAGFSRLETPASQHQQQQGPGYGILVKEQPNMVAGVRSGSRGSGPVVLSSDMLVALYASMRGTADQNDNYGKPHIASDFERLRSDRSSCNGSLLGRSSHGRRKLQEGYVTTARSLSYSDVLLSPTTRTAVTPATHTTSGKTKTKRASTATNTRRTMMRMTVPSKPLGTCAPSVAAEV